MSIQSAYIVPHPPLIIPEVGRGDERQISATINSYRQIAVEIAGQAPETLVITTPHAPMYRDYLHISPGSEAAGDFSRFQAPQVSIHVRYDQMFVQSLIKTAAAAGIPCGTEGQRDPRLDHGTLIPLYFIRQAWNSGKPFPKVVRIGLSGLSMNVHYQLGELIALTAENLKRRTILIASGDLSHHLKEDGPYGFAAEGPQFDRLVTEIITSGDLKRFLTLDPLLCEKAGECGWRSFTILAGAMNSKEVESELLSYEGPFGVGYAVGKFIPVN